LKSEIECWTYFLEDYQKELLDFEPLENYSSNGSHGKKFNVSESREEIVDYYSDIKKV